MYVVWAMLAAPPSAPPSAADRAALAEVNAARRATGAPPFAWDERLANAARMATAKGQDYHEDFRARVQRSGFPMKETPGRRPPRVRGETLLNVAEGSFPLASSPTGDLAGLLKMMQTTMAKGPHAQDFRDPYFNKIGISRGSRGKDGAFVVLIYGR